MQENLTRIFSILSTYENFEPYMLNFDGTINHALLREHINLWISQFDDTEQEFMASITANLLEQRFLSKENEINFINRLFTNTTLLKNNSMPRPLNIQTNGNSQKRLVEYYNSYMKKYNYSYSDNSVIYLDDFMFSGGRVFNDLSNWIPLQNKSYRIFVVVIGYHISDQFNKNTLLTNKILANNRAKNLNSSLDFLSCYKWENRLYKRNQSDILWPMHNFFKNQENIQHINPKFTYRDGFTATEQSFFKNNEDRVKFENICLKYGFQIIQRCQNPHATTKPLGNSFFGYGFGGLVFNYKNCPNNTPLLFWWGSSNPSDQMYNHWHPLMPRSRYG